ncbi:uncharacterized protein RCH25_035892 [Pelodytes ibericus]
MKRKCGLRFLLLAALLSAFGVWFLPVNSATVDIFLLLAGKTANEPTTLIEFNEKSTSETLDSKISHLDANVTDVTTLLTETEDVTDSYNYTQSGNKTQPAFTPSREPFSTTTAPNTEVTVVELTTINNVTECNTGIDRVTQTILSTQDTNSSDSITDTEIQSVPPEITTIEMDDNKTICIRNEGPTQAEVLAIVIGAVFMTILLSALLYQFAAFIKKKKAKRDSSIYIIENELHKYDIENELQPDTKL